MILQQPWRKQGLIHNIVGEGGTGKSIIFESVLGKIIGKQHYVTLHTVDDLVSRFNNISSKRILLFMDEACSDKADTSALKNMATGLQQRSEQKFRDTEYLDSFCNLWSSSNKKLSGVDMERDQRRLTFHQSVLKYLLAHPDIKGAFDKGEGFTATSKAYFETFANTLEENDEFVLKTCKYSFNHNSHPSVANFLYNLPLENEEFDPVSAKTVVVRFQPSKLFGQYPNKLLMVHIVVSILLEP
jgi:hypothetical protein